MAPHRPRGLAAASLVTGTMIATSASIGAVFAASRLLGSDDGLHGMVGVLFGAPVALFVGAVVAGFGSRTNPILWGIATAELAWGATSAAMVMFLGARPSERLSLFFMSLAAGQLFPPVPAAGALGGLLAGWLQRRRAVSTRCPSWQ